jgi:hypothetical protein
MRATVTLDDDTAALVQQRMREQGVSFKVALNDAIRAGTSARTHFHTEPADLGTPAVNLDQALRHGREPHQRRPSRRARRRAPRHGRDLRP